MRRHHNGKTDRLTKADRVRKQLKNQRRGRSSDGSRQREGTGKNWSLPKLVEEERLSKVAEVKRKLGIE